VLELAEAQERFARAMTSGDGAAIVGELRGGADPGTRLAIHLRHYAASLATALRDKYPALAWLVGEAALREAAVAYARVQPPQQPCIAEYGRDFPAFLARHPRAAGLPYLPSFGELEWAVAQASIAVEEPALKWHELAGLEAERIVDATLTLQPGVYHVRADWRIDELMQTYLTGAPPERFVLVEEPALLEVQGARGEFRLTRLGPATFAFRTALAACRTVGDAADAALALDSAFDAGAELRAIFAARLPIRYSTHEQENMP
jgi:hypothetical protein